MEMKPYARKSRNHGRTAAQYTTHPQGPPYYTPMDYSAAAAAAATGASAIYTSAPYPPPTAAYYPPPPQPPYFGYPTDKRTVEGMVRKQIEYYLSDENLIKDVFLRNKMDKDGFVLLSEIASFQRVASLTQDMETVVSALKESETIEICDGIKIRPKKDPLKWPLPSNLQLQYLPQPQTPQMQPQQPQQPPLIQQQQPPPPQQQQQQQQQPPPQQLPPQQQQPQQQHVTPSAQVITQQTQEEQNAPQDVDQQQQQRPPINIKDQPQEEPAPALMNQVNTIDHTDMRQHEGVNQMPQQPIVAVPNYYSGTNNIDNNNRSSLTYATAVTNKPLAASVVAGTMTATPAGTSGNNANANNNNSINNTSSNNNSSNNSNNSNSSNNSNISNHHHHPPTPHHHHHHHHNQHPHHHNNNTPVESEWKEVKSRRRRPGKA